MANATSLFEIGRRDDGTQLPWIPHTCPTGDCSFLGVASIGLQAISTAAQVGIWWELHDMKNLSKAQFEERRIGWLDDIANQWINEHRNISGNKTRFNPSTHH
jgi:hypothetical protein